MKQVYLGKAVTDTVVTTQVDGVPHRVLRTEFVDELDETQRRHVAAAAPSATRWRSSKLCGHVVARRSCARAWRCKRNQDLTWSQVVMAANTPMLLKAAMVDGRPDLGVMASGQVVGVIDDLPTCRGRRPLMAEADAVLARLA